LALVLRIKNNRGQQRAFGCQYAGLSTGLHVTVNEQDRAQVAQFAQQVQETTGASVEVAFVDRGYMGEQSDSRLWMPSNNEYV